MKMKNLAIVPIMLLLMTSVAMAINQPPEYSPVIKKPILEAETVVQPGETYTKTFDLIYDNDDPQPVQQWLDSCQKESNIPFNPNNNEGYWDGLCYYKYACYYAAKQGCESLSCATRSDCQLLATGTSSNPATVPITVSFLTSGLGEKFGVVAFISTVAMTYDTQTQTWVSTPVLEDYSKQTDLVTVPGAPAPPSIDIASLLNSLLTFIIAIFRQLIGQNILP